MSKIGVGIITCNRQDFYEKCIQSIKDCDIDVVVTINDGDPYADTATKYGKYIQHKTNKGVGITKNEALKYLIETDCEHIFLIEDDIIVKDAKVFQAYIDASYETGLRHFMFGYHGPANKDSNKNPSPRLIVEYSPSCSIAFNEHCVGALCYYHRTVLNSVGLMDEQFKNAWEHVDHSLQIVNGGFIPSYWWWPDLADSYDYLDELACSEDSSTIRWENSEEKIPKKDWLENIEKGAQYFYTKNKCFPNQVQSCDETGLIQKIKQIKEKYSCNGV